MEIKVVKEKIQSLITQAVEENEKQKTLLNFLFRKLDEVKELEILENLKDYQSGKYLKAYLLYKSICRANYQPEHLEITQLENVEKCLKMIKKDINATFRENGKKELEQPKELSDQQLLALLSERIRLGKICLKKDGRYLFEVGPVGKPIPTKIFLDSGEIEYIQVDEFFDKHKKGL